MSDDQMKPESADQAPGQTQNCSPDASGPMTWSCRPSLEELYRYMDGAMEPVQQQHVTSHLSDCNGCDDFFHFQTGLRRMIGDRCRSELPMDLPDRVFRAIDDLR